MSILNDIWGNEVIVTKDFVSHRNRLIDVGAIQTFQAKGKRLYINTFKQNTSAPTMCIFFESKEQADDVYCLMRDTYYGPLALQKAPEVTLSVSQVCSAFLLAVSPVFMMGLLVLGSPAVTQRLSLSF